MTVTDATKHGPPRAVVQVGARTARWLSITPRGQIDYSWEEPVGLFESFGDLLRRVGDAAEDTVLIVSTLNGLLPTETPGTWRFGAKPDWTLSEGEVRDCNYAKVAPVDFTASGVVKLADAHAEDDVVLLAGAPWRHPRASRVISLAQDAAGGLICTWHTEEGVLRRVQPVSYGELRPEGSMETAVLALLRQEDEEPAGPSLPSVYRALGQHLGWSAAPSLDDEAVRDALESGTVFSQEVGLGISVWAGLSMELLRCTVLAMGDVGDLEAVLIDTEVTQRMDPWTLKNLLGDRFIGTASLEAVELRRFAMLVARPWLAAKGASVYPFPKVVDTQG